MQNLVGSTNNLMVFFPYVRSNDVEPIPLLGNRVGENPVMT
jgi:hypothetical protein